jgi:arsenate reductase
LRSGTTGTVFYPTRRTRRAAARAALTEARAIALMLAQPSMIKRPVLDIHDRLTVGFKPEAYARLF